VVSTETNSDLDHRRDHGDTFGAFHHLVRNGFVFNRHDLVEYFGGVVDPFVDVGTLIVS
jgi:hypothetical protein